MPPHHPGYGEGPPPTPAWMADDGGPLAGNKNGLFFLRDAHDNFRLFVQGRAQIDFYSYAGPGVTDTTLKPTLFLRRIRPEISGDFFGHFWWMFAGDFGATALDNPRGTNETSAAAPGAAPSAASGRFASAQTNRVSAAPTDVFVSYRCGSLVNAQIGQFDANFMMENRTSDKYIPFMERSLAVRAVGIPTNKEIGLMLWGETENKLVYYSLGLYDGDGQNKLNVDARLDTMGRVFVHPLYYMHDSPLKDAQIGASVRYGSRDKDYVNYDYPGLSTQGNYTFWQSTYGGAGGNTHIIPSGDQLGVAGELRVPISMFDVTSEVVYIDNHTREAIEGFEATNSERFGQMKGVSYYAQLGMWPLGNRDINGVPGYQNPPKLDFKKPDPVQPAHALQLLVKWEQVFLKYDSASRGGVADAKNIDGRIRADALSLGANFWFTKHVRLSANYVLNMFPDSAPVKPTTATSPAQTTDNRALAPGNTLGIGVNDGARDSAHVVHEILARVAIAL
jgi:hypothetical protein